MAQTGLNAEQMANGETMTHLMNLTNVSGFQSLAELVVLLGLVLLMMRSKVPEYRTIGKLSFDSWNLLHQRTSDFRITYRF